MVSFNQNDCLAKMRINNVDQTVKATYPWCDKKNRKMKVNDKPVTIGNNNDLTRPAAGRIRDVAYYDRALSADEQAKVFKGDYMQKGLVYHLPMCNADCKTVPDTSGNGYNGAPQSLKW
jgi:hypothetical protein